MQNNFGPTDSHLSRPHPDDLIIRQSTIGSMQLCPARVGLSTLDGFSDRGSEALVFGSTVHNHLEKFLNGHGSDIWPIELATRDELRESLTQVEVKDDFLVADVASMASINAMLDEVLTACRQWHATVWPELDSLGGGLAEQEMQVPFGTLPAPNLCYGCYESTCDSQIGDRCDNHPGDRKVWLQGTPDLVVQGHGMFDWKTSGRAWKVDDNGRTKGSFNAQAPLYLWMWKQRTGEMLRDFTFWVYDRRNAAWQDHHTIWNDEQIDAALLNAWQYVLMLDAQAFPFTPTDSPYGKFQRGWHCSAKYCGGWEICPGKAMIDDGADLSARIDATW